MRKIIVPFLCLLVSVGLFTELCTDQTTVQDYVVYDAVLGRDVKVQLTTSGANLRERVTLVVAHKLISRSASSTEEAAVMGAAVRSALIDALRFPGRGELEVEFQFIPEVYL